MRRLVSESPWLLLKEFASTGGEYTVVNTPRQTE